MEIEYQYYYDKLELLSITLRNKVLTQKQIEIFINNFIDQ